MVKDKKGGGRMIFVVLYSFINLITKGLKEEVKGERRVKGNERFLYHF